jgi:hypothetical protein
MRLTAATTQAKADEVLQAGTESPNQNIWNVAWR